jgi:hypothetical protein
MNRKDNTRPAGGSGVDAFQRFLQQRQVFAVIPAPDPPP